MPGTGKEILMPFERNDAEARLRRHGPEHPRGRKPMPLGEVAEMMRTSKAPEHPRRPRTSIDDVRRSVGMRTEEQIKEDLKKKAPRAAPPEEPDEPIEEDENADFDPVEEPEEPATLPKPPAKKHAPPPPTKKKGGHKR